MDEKVGQGHGEEHGGGFGGFGGFGGGSTEVSFVQTKVSVNFLHVQEAPNPTPPHPRKKAMCR